MAYWIKINYERSIYLIDLDSITAFCCQPNKRITFWLPNTNQEIVLNKQNCEYDYYLILEYIKKKIEIGYKTQFIYLTQIGPQTLVDQIVPLVNFRIADAIVQVRFSFQKSWMLIAVVAAFWIRIWTLTYFWNLMQLIFPFPLHLPPG